MDGLRRRSLTLLLVLVVEELQPGAPPFVEEPLRALVCLGADDKALFPSGIITRGYPSTEPAVELDDETGHRWTFIVDDHGAPPT